MRNQLFITLLIFALGACNPKQTTLFPANGAQNVNPDTHLQITFDTIPQLGTSGQIRVYDAADNRLVDVLDLSIPPGPTTPDTTKGATYTPIPYEYSNLRATNTNTQAGTPSGMALPTSNEYQLTIIGGFSDAFHFYPVTIDSNKASIHLHHNLLEYGKTYYVEIDSNVFVLPNSKFEGMKGSNSWKFSTKAQAPALNSERLVVSADGSGDFNTIQGALDWIPDNNATPVTIEIKNGIYEEIVYFRLKNNVTIVGESREGVVIQYANNEVFNPHPVNVKTNELRGTFPSRRAVFAADNCLNIQLANLTIRNKTKGQAEGLLLNGERNMVCNVTIIGSGDALQTNGSAYFSNCLIVGDGDTVLGRGPAFFSNCHLQSYGAFMWIRNTDDNHGNVFVNCTFETLGGGETEIARTPTNKGKNYPFSEAVLINCKLSGISPKGWGPIGGETNNIRYWEHNSSNLTDGQPVDASQRHEASRQLTLPNDSALIADYQNPAFVLNGWTPDLSKLQAYTNK